MILKFRITLSFLKDNLKRFDSHDTSMAPHLKPCKIRSHMSILVLSISLLIKKPAYFVLIIHKMSVRYPSCSILVWKLGGAAPFPDTKMMNYLLFFLNATLLWKLYTWLPKRNKKKLSKRYLLCDEVIVILIRKLHQKSPKCRVLNYQDKKSIELLLRWRRWKIGELGFFLAMSAFLILCRNHI